MKAKIKPSAIAGLIIALAALAAEAVIEQVIAPSYWIKSGCKLLLFCGAILIYKLISGRKLCEIVAFRKMKPAGLLYILMGCAYAGIIILFFLLRGRIDMSGIRQSLTEKEQLTRENCLFVFAYIILFNSFLEESFFRGFLTGLFGELGIPRAGWVISGLCFALYHIGMVATWFDPFVFILCIAGLAVVGAALQFIDHKYGSMKAGWLVHACANLAINTIGVFLIFEI